MAERAEAVQAHLGAASAHAGRQREEVEVPGLLDEVPAEAERETGLDTADR